MSVWLKKQQWGTAVAAILAGMAEMRGLREYLYAGIEFGTKAAAANIEQAAADAEARKKELAEAQKLSQSAPLPVPPPPPIPPPSHPPVPHQPRGSAARAESSGAVLALASSASSSTAPALSATALALRKPASQRTDEEVMAAAEGRNGRVARSRSPHGGDLPEGYDDC